MLAQCLCVWPSECSIRGFRDTCSSVEKVRLAVRHPQRRVQSYDVVNKYCCTLDIVYASPIHHHNFFIFAYLIGFQPFNKYKMFYGGTSSFLFLLFVVSSCLDIILLCVNSLMFTVWFDLSC